MEISNKTKESVIELVSNKSRYSDQELIDAIILRIECEFCYKELEKLQLENKQILFELEKTKTILTLKDK